MSKRAFLSLALARSTEAASRECKKKYANIIYDKSVESVCSRKLNQIYNLLKILNPFKWITEKLKINELTIKHNIDLHNHKIKIPKYRINIFKYFCEEYVKKNLYKNESAINPYSLFII